MSELLGPWFLRSLNLFLHFFCQNLSSFKKNDTSLPNNPLQLPMNICSHLSVKHKVDQCFSLNLVPGISLTFNFIEKLRGNISYGSLSPLLSKL
ncbi:unnamed protein product [Arabidopsis halleri]